jgi:hypothetical protein
MRDAITELRRQRDAYRRLCVEALHLAMYGERAPGGDETWAEWERKLRDLDEHNGGSRA